MSATQGIRVGRAFVELLAEDSKLVRGRRQSRSKYQGHERAAPDTNHSGQRATVTTSESSSGQSCHCLSG